MRDICRAWNALGTRLERDTQTETFYLVCTEMATPLTRQQLQELKAIREEAVRKAMIEKEREIWDAHVEDSVKYIYSIVVNSAEQGKDRVTIHNFNAREPGVIENQKQIHKHNSKAVIAHRATYLGAAISSHDGSSISIACIPDILKRLSVLFPDSSIEMEAPSLTNGGHATLCMDWS